MKSSEISNKSLRIIRDLCGNQSSDVLDEITSFLETKLKVEVFVWLSAEADSDTFDNIIDWYEKHKTRKFLVIFNDFDSEIDRVYVPLSQNELDRKLIEYMDKQ